MPVNYRIDHDMKTVFTTLEGTLTDEEMIDVRLRVKEDPEFNPDYSHLIDCRQVGELKASVAGVQTINSSNMFSAESRRAFIVPSDVAYGFSRMFQVYRQEGPESTEVFRDIDEALEGKTHQYAQRNITTSKNERCLYV